MTTALQNAPALEHGVRLRYPLRDAQGQLLLASGAAVTERLRRLLTQRGITVGIQATLRPLEGQRDIEIPLAKQELLIGRRPECDISIDSAIVSGHHCRVHRRALVVYVEDLRSRNGTFLNDQRIEQETPLSDQDKLRVGQAEYAVHICAALETDSAEAVKALAAWKLSEAQIQRRSSAYSPTVGELDLDADE